MIRISVSAALCAVALSACAPIGPGQPEDAAPVAANAPTGQIAQGQGAADLSDPALVGAASPPPSARTQEALDTTTSAQRIMAAAPAAPDRASRSLGTTVVSLGSPSEPGFWLKTPLVQTRALGRVAHGANGKSVAVTLIPIDGPATGGSRLSLPAMRLIGALLADLTEVEVLHEG